MSPIGGSGGVEQAGRAFGIDRINRPGRRSRAEGAGAPARAPSDAVSLSDQAKTLAAARRAVDSAPDIRQDKVDAIKQAISDGTYSVSARELARKMIDAGIV
jgi:negative regulator of flagellin synthesis FlgM